MKILPFFRTCLPLFLLTAFYSFQSTAQDLPTKYLTLELFTNTPCPICGSQNPGLFNRLANYEGEYHLISFYPGKPYSTCVFYQANISENTTRYNHYTGEIFGSPTVALNGVDFKSSSGVNNTVLDGLTGGTSWLHVDVDETTGSDRTVTITLEDVVGGSVTSGRLYAVIVEKEVMYNAPNGETLHHNVFRRFLTAPAGEEVDLSTGTATREYQYTLDGSWNENETYVIAWLSDPDTKEIYNSGTRFDPDFISSLNRPADALPLSLYPNPANTWLQVTIPDDVTSGQMQMYNALGQLVYQDRIDGSPIITIKVDPMPAGQYHLRLQGVKTLYSGIVEIVR